MRRLGPCTPADRVERRAIAPILAREMAQTCALAEDGARVSLLARLCAPLVWRAAGEFAVGDRMLHELGPRAGAAWVLERFVRGVEASGSEDVPREGPLLVAANHPGLADTLALLAAIGRDDVSIVAADFPLLRELRGLGPRFIFVPRKGPRMAALTDIARRLRAGESVLVFPAGRLELDPALWPSAGSSLSSWSSGLALVARRVPGTRVVPALVSGVVSPAAARHRLVRLRRGPSERQRMAALLQLLVPSYRAAAVRIAFGAVLGGAERTRNLHQDVIAEMGALLRDRAAPAAA